MAMSNYMEALAAGRYAFIDLGSGTGGSIDHCVRRFGRGPGLGFELDADEAAAARRSGYDVVAADVRTARVPNHSVAFVASMDFLEHLPNEATAASVLARFAPAAREFLFIRHPSFEGTEYLASLGLKLCWSDWSDHLNLMRIEGLVALLHALPMTELAIFPRGLMTDAANDQIVPLSAPTDTRVYDPSRHAGKPCVRFDRPLFAQYDLFVRLRGGLSDAEWERVLWADVAEDAAVWPAHFSASPTAAPGAVRCDFGFYDASSSRWRMRNASGTETALKYGAEGRGWLPFTGVFAAGRQGLGVYDPATGHFFIRHTFDEGLADVTVGFGAPGGIPVAGDWTGTGTDTIGVYMPATGQWFLRNTNASGPADASFSFGAPRAGWLPVVGDWDGDGRDSVGLYDPATGAWHLRSGSRDGHSDSSFTFGPAGGSPVAGDWDGDGRDSIGVYAPDWGMWILRNTNANGPADSMFVYRGDGVPVAARVAPTQRV